VTGKDGLKKTEPVYEFRTNKPSLLIASFLRCVLERGSWRYAKNIVRVREGLPTAVAFTFLPHSNLRFELLRREVVMSNLQRAKDIYTAFARGDVPTCSPFSTRPSSGERPRAIRINQMARPGLGPRLYSKSSS
jgi:hypothetical protein